MKGKADADGRCTTRGSALAKPRGWNQAARIGLTGPAPSGSTVRDQLADSLEIPPVCFAQCLFVARTQQHNFDVWLKTVLQFEVKSGLQTSILVGVAVFGQPNDLAGRLIVNE